MDIIRITLVVALLWAPLYSQAREERKVTAFAFGSVGYAGVMSWGEVRFRKIWRSEDPVSGFEDWYRTGNNEEKMYSLTGLFYHARHRFEDLKEDIVDSKIITFEGCLGNYESAKTVLDRLETGYYTSHMPRKSGEQIDDSDAEAPPGDELTP